jgi:hypothetical protein
MTLNEALGTHVAVVYKIQFTEEFLVEATRRYRDQLWWRAPFIGFKWLLALALVGLFTICVVAEIYWVAFIFSVIIGSLTPGWPIDRALIRHQFRKSPYCGSDVTIQMDNDGFRASQDQGNVDLRWNAFTKARRLKNGILLFQGPHVYNWLPDNALEDIGALEEAEKLIRANVPDFKDYLNNLSEFQFWVQKLSKRRNNVN